MARPLKNNLEYFSHDTSMRDDRKIRALRNKFGAEGYALYCMMIEALGEAEYLLLEWDEESRILLAGDFGVDEDLLVEFVGYCLRIDLLQTENGYVLCRELDRRAKPVFDKRKTDLKGLRVRNCGFRDENPVNEAGIPQSKVKKSKEKKKKEKIYKKDISDGVTMGTVTAWTIACKYVDGDINKKKVDEHILEAVYAVGYDTIRNRNGNTFVQHQFERTFAELVADGGVDLSGLQEDTRMQVGEGIQCMMCGERRADYGCTQMLNLDRHDGRKGVRFVCSICYKRMGKGFQNDFRELVFKGDADG